MWSGTRKDCIHTQGDLIISKLSYLRPSGFFLQGVVQNLGWWFFCSPRIYHGRSAISEEVSQIYYLIIELGGHVWFYLKIFIFHSLVITKFVCFHFTGKSKEAEIKRINKELANIRSKFKGDKTLDGYQKKKYVCKLLFIFLLGHDIDFGQMEAVNLLSSNKYSEKQIVSHSFNYNLTYVSLSLTH